MHDKDHRAVKVLFLKCGVGGNTAMHVSYSRACFGSQGSLLVEHQTRDQKVVSSNSCRSGGEFSPPEFVC